MIENEMILVEGGKISDENSMLFPEKYRNIDSFLIGKYPVTVALWNSINNIKKNVEDDHPVTNIFLKDIFCFCNLLSVKENLPIAYSITRSSRITCDMKSTGYRLPNKIEWLWAALGGNESQGFIYSGSNDIKAVAWYDAAFGKTHPIGLKLPNELGIYDMSGNVFEWCWDIDILNKSKSGTIVSDTKSKNVLKGGCYYSSAWNCPTSTVFPQNNYITGEEVGFRIVRTYYET